MSLDPGLVAATQPRSARLLQFALDELLYPLAVCGVLAVQTVVGLATLPDASQAPVLVFALPLLLAVAYLASRVMRLWPRLTWLARHELALRRFGSDLEQQVQGPCLVCPWPPGLGFEIDLLLVCSAGAFVIDLAPIPAPAGRLASAVFDGTVVHIEGAAPLHDPVARVKVLAREFAARMKERTGLFLPVTPALVLPGWHVQQRHASKLDITVSPPEEFIAWLRGLPPRLAPADVMKVRMTMTVLQQEHAQRQAHAGQSGDLR